MNTENYINVSIGWMNANLTNLVKFLFISHFWTVSVTIGIDNAYVVDPSGLEREAHHNLF